ncbi:DNA mismatch repair endonuclease MutL [Phocaeicola paurosaccharolyticus]|jgi:DNA mismatch repair protein MutL|uniref:DNA mismatch repair endonuclease MutL n=1 Tax=Phocaeicola paurosaccharolyticus TaxID=732242 RepID=UPI0004690C45|nr:DNA mismatch repair endonuclease MutL [Phocaeicola paurosaccharolyticus]
MSDIIRLLPDSVANQIAAGEVIQRPASVIKELVENSIDAGAKHIDVIVTDAGKSSIQVIDDGKGMSETDARLSFERHATSKIKEASDLFALHTMGFRGEALASIAAVAQIDLKTRQEGDDLGTHLVISGSKFESQEVIPCQKGCNVSVKNIFFNIPARRKFLKSNQTELTNILNEFERIVLVNPDINFTLHNNDSEMLNLPATQLRQRIMGVFGKKINQELFSIEVNTTMINISGFIGKPESARKKGARQFFFVNGRYMRHPYFHKAVMDAYEHLIPTGEQVSYFIYFEVDPSNIDVNIHPTKTEIKFENEPAIWQILDAAVKESLGKFNAVPSIDFDTEDMPDIPAIDTSYYSGIEPPKTTFNPDYNPFNTSTYSPSSYSNETRNWSSLYEGLEKANGDELAPYDIDLEDSQTSGTQSFQITHSERLTDAVQENSTQHYQFKGRFILTSVKSGLMIIDQQRAHIRILYERYLNQIKNRQHASQGMLFPEIVQFPMSEIPVLENIMEDLSFLGFELTPLGGGSYAINGVPSGIEGLNPAELVKNMVNSAVEKECKVKDEVENILALTLAKSAAIVPGQVLTNDEMNSLVDGLFALATPNYTPDGKTVLHVLEEDEIEKIFK